MSVPIRRRLLAALLLGTSLVVGACGRGERGGVSATAQEGKNDERGAAGQDGDDKATGRIVVVEMHSDADGNYYKPADVEVHPGDVIRFTLKSGVHNVNFLADSNSGKSTLPIVSDMLQLPGQTHDLKVTLAGGIYYYQCDPHAALGMKGHITVGK